MSRRAFKQRAKLEKRSGFAWPLAGFQALEEVKLVAAQMVRRARNGKAQVRVHQRKANAAKVEKERKTKRGHGRKK